MHCGSTNSCGSILLGVVSALDSILYPEFVFQLGRSRCAVQMMLTTDETCAALPRFLNGELSV